jgi:hypothetical protein
MKRFHLSLSAALLILAGCSAPNARVVTTVNRDAALTGDISIDPLQWRVITSGVDPTNSTMYTLFGNDIAVQYARTSTERNYPAGSVLSLATWHQQEDSRWFGGKIPARPKSVEFVEVLVSNNGRRSYSYRAFEGSPLKQTINLEGPPDGRVTYLLSQRAAVMP